MNATIDIESAFKFMRLGFNAGWEYCAEGEQAQNRGANQMSACPYCDQLEAYALLPAEPVTHRFYYRVNETTNSVERCDEQRPGLGHKMRYPIACQPDYNIECKRGQA